MVLWGNNKMLSECKFDVLQFRIVIIHKFTFLPITNVTICYSTVLTLFNSIKHTHIIHIAAFRDSILVCTKINEKRFNSNAI